MAASTSSAEDPRSISRPIAGPPTVRDVAAKKYAGGPVVNVYWAGSEIVVLRREGPDRKLIRETFPVEHSAFLPKSEVSAEQLREIRSATRVYGVRSDGDYWRVEFYQRKSALRAPETDGWFARNKIRVLEADVDPVRRFITDYEIEIDKPRRVYLDLETDSRVPFNRGSEARILSWSLVDEDGGRVGRVLLRDDDQSEKQLLRDLFRRLGAYDLVLAWNGDRFDFIRIGARVGILGIGVELRRWLWLDHMRLFNKLNVSAAESGDEKQFAGLAAVHGSVCHDPERSKKMIELGRLGGPTTWGIWEEGSKDATAEVLAELEAAAKVDDEERYRSALPAEWRNLRDYNVDDSVKMAEIEGETGYVDLLCVLCQSTFTLPDSRGMLPTRYVEGFLLRLGKKRGMRFPSRVWEEDKPEPGAAVEEPKQYKGGFCLEPTQLGIVRGVHVLDFARMYPSIIRSWNMSPETFRPDIVITPKWWEFRPSYLQHVPKPPANPLPAGHCVAAFTECVFVNEPQGILAEAVAEILVLRKYWDDIKKSCAPGTPEWKEADRRSTAYKNIVNGYYGVVGADHSRFHVREVAESCSQTGVWLIQETIAAAEARGWKVIYADTDSAFVIGCTEAEFVAFVEWCNVALYPGLLETKGVAQNFISIAYEKAFDVLVMVGKKRYAGNYLHFKGKRATADSKPEIKGLEYKRGDSARIARRLQEETIKAMLSGNTDPAFYEELVARYRARVLGGELEREDVVLSKRLTKPLREYVRTKKKDGAWARQSPHIEVARLLEQAGRDVGAGVRIEYVVLDDSKDPPVYASAEDWTPAVEVDRNYLWETMVFPPSQRVLEVVMKATDWRKWERSRPPKTRAPEGAGELFKGKENPKHRDVKSAPTKAPPPAPTKVKQKGWGQGSLF